MASATLISRGVAASFFLVAITTLTPADANSQLDQTQVAAELRAMGAAANAHDVDRHVGFYAHDAAVMLIVNGEAIVGWEEIHKKQAEWWSNGKTDVVYEPQGTPQFRVLGTGVILSTLFMTSRRTQPSGEIRINRLAVSSIWEKRPEGWRVIYSHESMSR